MGSQKSVFEKLLNFFKLKPRNRSELIILLQDAYQRNLINSEMLSIIEKVFQVSEIQVRDVMVPRVQMAVVELNSPLEDLIPLLVETAHSRFPVVNESGVEVVGILLAKDLLKYCFCEEKGDFSVAQVMRPAVFIPESKRLDILLREFRINYNHMAVVVDEYGHIAGLVTIEDVLEQIVGDIEDEYDEADADHLIVPREKGHYLVKAQISIDEFNDYFQVKLSDEGYASIGGLIIKGFGRVPRRNEFVQIHGFHFKVLQSDSRRVSLLDVVKL